MSVPNLGLTPHLFQDIHNGRLFLILRSTSMTKCPTLSLLRDRNGDTDV
jgi:hypothetical protein